MAVYLLLHNSYKPIHCLFLFKESTVAENMLRVHQLRCEISPSFLFLCIFLRKSHCALCIYARHAVVILSVQGRVHGIFKANRRPMCAGSVYRASVRLSVRPITNLSHRKSFPHILL